jgi:hypothetical protein
MELKLFMSVIIIIPLIWAFIYLLKRRQYFRSVYPFGFAAIFVFIARVLDVVTENPSIHAAQWLGYSEGSFISSVNLMGDITDVIGVLFLVLGFVRAIESLRSGERRIETLEALLPLCAWCKRVRTEEGIWKPVEEYLQERGAPEATHGICPDCAARLLHDKRGDWTEGGQIPEDTAKATRED